MNAQAWIALAVGVCAVADDLKRRHIANWIPAAALAGGVGWQVGLSGWLGLWTAFAGAVVGFSVFLIFFLLGGMGGGDIKLMAGFGALLGTGLLLKAAFWTALVGGVFALLIIGWRKWRAAMRKRAGQPETGPDDSIPYAPAIAIGVWLSLLTAA